MKRFLTTVVAATGLLVGALPGAAAHAAPKPGHKVGIDVLNVTGSGCRHGTVAVALSADNEAFTVIFSGYLAQAGAGTTRTDTHKDCRIKLRINAAAGFSHAITGVDHRGFAVLAPGATAEQLSGYYFQGSGKTPDNRHLFVGPYDDFWQATDRTDPTSISFGGCGAARNVNIGSELRIGAGTSDPAATSFIGTDATDAALTATYRLAWRAC
jgi:hypothetical protein